MAENSSQNKSPLKLIFFVVIAAVLAFMGWKFISQRGAGSGASSRPVTSAQALATAKGIFDDAAATFKSITDVNSAKAAVPRLDSINKSVTDMVAMKNQLSPETKAAVIAAIKEYVPQFEQMVASLYAIPGVKEVIEPKIDQFKSTFESLVK